MNRAKCGKPLTLKRVSKLMHQIMEETMWCRSKVEVRDNCCNNQRVSLVSLLHISLLQQFSYDILVQVTEQFNFCVGDDMSLIGSHFEKENLKGSRDHVTPPWGEEECRLKSQQNSDIVLLCIYFLSN